MKITNHTELRRRVSLDASKPVMTDQSDLKSSDINHIMLQYSKTGLLPVQAQKIAQYIDNTEIPSLEEAHALISEAKEMFYALPAQIRKLMDNDPTQLVDFIRNPENQDILIKNGLILSRNVEPETVRADAPSVDKTQEVKND